MALATEVGAAEVRLWGRQIGAVLWNPRTNLGAFEYTNAFQQSGIELAPLTMPLGPGIWSFPELARETYRGLPGLLADSLPDRWGSELVDRWLARSGRSRDTFTPVELLCYVGSRGMGALEYRPVLRRAGRAVAVEVEELADLAAQVLSSRAGVNADLSDEGLSELLRVGTSAGGARAKALIAWNPETNEVRSGQTSVPDGFTHWILKFDGVGSSDRDLRDPRGYGRVEHAYHRMAEDAGINVPLARLHVDGQGRAHFMSRRFDRTDRGEKVHMLSLSAIAHYDFNQAGRWGYEDAMQVLQRLGAPAIDVEEQYRRMVFNVVARNQDDHTKNIAFVMDKRGSWRLSPAFDITWAYNPSGEWTNRHQMTIAGKRDDFSRADLVSVGQKFGVRRPLQVLDEVLSVVSEWGSYAVGSEVPDELRRTVAASLRLDIP